MHHQEKSFITIFVMWAIHLIINYYNDYKYLAYLEWVGVGGFFKTVVIFSHVGWPLIFLWPPPGMSE